MINKVRYIVFAALLALFSVSAHAVLPTIFATQPTGNVQASLLDTNFTFIENQGVQALTTTGSSNTYVATPADAWTVGYSGFVGRALTVKPNFTNTGASTFNVSGLGAASIYKNVGGVQTALASGDIVSGTPAILISDGTNFLLANPTSANAGIISIKPQKFISAGTYTPCTGLLFSQIQLWGAGGGGGGANGNPHDAGGGGAGGSALKFYSAGTIGVSQSVTVGTGGSAGATADGLGGTGGTTSVGVLLSAGGGVGGGGGSANVVAGGIGGAGSNGTINGTGAPGGNGGAQGGGANYGGFGASTSLGGGGVSPVLTAQAGTAGAANSGAGGSGAFDIGSTGKAGGAGADGIVFITDYCSQ